MGGFRTHEHAGAGRIAREILVCARRTPLACAVLTLYWIWIDLVFQSTAFFGVVEASPGFFVPLWLLPVTFAGGMLALCVACRKRVETFFGGRGAILLAAALSFFGVLLECMRLFEGEASSVLDLLELVLGAVLIGCGLPLLLFDIARLYVWQDPRVILIQSIVGVLCSALCCVAISLLPSAARPLILCVVPLAMGLLMLADADALKRAEQAPEPIGRQRFPGKLFGTSFFHGLSLGALFAASALMSLSTDNLGTLAGCLVVAAVAFVWLSLVRKADFNSLIYQGAFVVLASGAILLAAVPGASEVSSSLQLLGFCFMHLIMWGLNAYLVRNFRTSVLWIVGLGTAGWMAGELVAGLAIFAAARIATPSVVASVSEGVLAILLMAGALSLMDSRNVKDGWGLASPTSTTRAYASIDAAIEHLVLVYGFSERESDVFLLFARGRNRKRISDALVVSEETVKSHVASIYRKTGAHSQQEVIDLVERELS